MDMRFTTLFFSILLNSILLFGQDIDLKSSVVASAGENKELYSVNISKWRIGEVHVVMLHSNNTIETSINKWDVNSYPNPFYDKLNLDFNITEKNKFAILVTDILGKKILYSEEKIIMPKEIVQLDLALLSPGMYLVSIIPENKDFNWALKVQKN